MIRQLGEVCVMGQCASYLEGIRATEETNWWYTARKELILGLVKGERILEVGCGTGTIAAALARNSSIVGVDPTLTAVQMTKLRTSEAHLDLEVIQADGLELCFASEAFEAAICADVIEHVDDDYSFLLEVRRVLEPAGYLLITAPANRLLWSQLDEEVGHRRRYDLGSIQKLLRKAGFEEIRVRYWNSILFPIMFVFRKLIHPGFTKELATARRFNPILYRLLKSEERVGFPFGSSIIASAHKPIGSP
jgi:2-polyprenyl-3-methyl-5-hydroxy-6-metoxy-1,4-benzoquinol methylase